MNVGQMVKGMLDLKVNDDKSYDVTAECRRGGRERGVVALEGTTVKSSGFYHLQDQTYYVGEKEGGYG